MDIKEKIQQLVDTIQADKTLMDRFQKDPAKVVDELINKLVGVDLPDEQVEKIVEGVKAKLSLNKVSDVLGGLGGLFGKK